jgi:hypothetical protein
MSTTQKRQRRQNSDKPEFQEVPIEHIHPSPENDRLYAPIDFRDPSIQSLAKSIRDKGLLEPIVLTLDGYIVSGHRRFAGVRLAGLRTARCRYIDVHRGSEPEKFLVLLREHNRQREKTRAERLREEVVSINPDQAHRALIEHRKKKSRIEPAAMTIEGIAHRCKISDAKQPMLDAIDRVLKERREFWPLTVRMIHYAILNNPPLKHASKPDSVYANDERSYEALVELLSRARLVGVVPKQAICDETRPVTTWNVHKTAGEYVAEQQQNYLNDFARDLLQSQPNHIEIVGEKNTIEPIIRSVSAKYTIPMTIGRGYCSQSPRDGIAERFKKSGKEKLVLLILTDFDPDGEEIAQAFARSMRDEQHVKSIHPIKVALNGDQVKQFNLPVGLKAKKTSTHYKKFVAKHGPNAYELEALAPADLQRILEDAIDSVLDIDAFNRELDAEKQDAAFLQGVREQAAELLMDLTDEGGNQ